MTTFTAEQILALAPDASSASAGRGLANLRTWQNLGSSGLALWGECQGSGKKPYQTQIDLSEPAFRCSCPSHKFPCKHGIGLLLLHSASPSAFETAPPPPWVAEWLGKRDETAQKRAARADDPPDEAAATKRAASKQRTAARREANALGGVADLGAWLEDLARAGLASLAGRPQAFYAEPAARAQDAQLPGLRRRILDLSSIPGSGASWESRALYALGALYALVRAVQQLQQLPPALQADVRAALGVSVKREDLLAREPAVSGPWCVLRADAFAVEHEQNLRGQRIWLRHSDSGADALLLDFAFANRPFGLSLPAGAVIEADLVFHPGGAPLRAEIVRRGAALGGARIPGTTTIAAALERYAAALAANPWVELFPLAIAAARLGGADGRWEAIDSEGRALPIAPAAGQPWQLLALSGGRPLPLFGVWDGARFTPLSAEVDGELVMLQGRAR